MNENCFNPPINSPHQEGAVLITALILLVVMTMLGISGMEATKLETRMAANVHDYNQAFQTAEAGLAWTFNACVQGNEIKSLEQLDHQWVSVPCQSNNITPPRNTLTMRGGIEPRQNGNMNEVTYLNKSIGSSGDFNHPEAITVTLLGGMMLPTGARDPRAKMDVGDPEPEKQKKLCPFNDDDGSCDDDKWDGKDESKEELLQRCANKIKNILNNNHQNNEECGTEEADKDNLIEEACQQLDKIFSTEEKQKKDCPPKLKHASKDNDNSDNS